MMVVNLRAMTFNDRVELTNVGGQSIRYEQNGNDVDLYVGGILMATFKGSGDGLSAEDMVAATMVSGDAPSSIRFDGTPHRRTPSHAYADADAYANSK